MAIYDPSSAGNASAPPPRVKREDLTFFLKGMQKRFPDVPQREIHETVEAILEEMKPSRDRTQLNRRIIRRLKRFSTRS